MSRMIRIASVVWALGWLVAGGGVPVLAKSPFSLPEAAETGEPGAAPATAAAVAAGDAPTEPVIEPHPLPLLARAIEETSRSLREIEKRLREDRVSKEIDASLDETARTLDTLASLLESADLSAQSFRSLTDRRQSWSRLDSRIESIEKTLEKRAEALDGDRALLRQMDARWVATRESLVREGVPKPVAKRVDDALDRVRSLHDPARGAFASTLLLQERAASQRIGVTEALELLDTAVKGAQERVFAQRGRPLWKLLVERGEGPGLLKDLVQTVRDKGGSIREYFGEGRGAFAALLVILAALQAVAFWVRSRATAFEEGSPSRTLVETRPIASALLVGVVVWIYGEVNAPRPVVELAVLALTAPLYLVLSIWLPSVLRPSLAWLVGLVLFDRVRGLVSDDSWAGRLSVLAMSLVGAAMIVWTLRARGPWKDLRGRSRWIRAFVLAGRGVALILVVSAVANVVGQAGLAELLFRGSLASLFLGAVLTTASLVVESWLCLLTPVRDPAAGTSMLSEAERLRSFLASLTRVAATAGWVLSILTVFGIGNAVIGLLKGMLFEPWSIGSVSIALSNLLGFALALAVGLTTARLLRLLLDHSILPGLELPRGVPAAVSTTVQYLVAALAVLVAIFALGIEASRFTILASAVGVGVGFGLQNIVNNFVSGLILLYERPIQNGDTVEMGTLMGTVGRIGVRSSTVRTFDGAEVIVPNATLISNEVTNWTLSDRLRRVEIRVGVSYGSDPRRVIALLEEAARSHEWVLAQPAPTVLFQGFGESSLDFSVRVWTANFEDWLRLRSQLHVEIFEALAKEGIEIPFPQRDVHLKGDRLLISPPAK